MKLCSFENCNKKYYAKELCQSHYEKAKYAKNPTPYKKRAARYRNSEVGKQQSKNWNKNFRSEYFQNHLDKHAERQSRRRFNKKQATPKWSNIKLLQEFYANCPEGYEVDHIIPLKNEKVQGLHVPWNLQYLTESDNIKKSNKFDGTYENESWKMKKDNSNAK